MQLKNEFIKGKSDLKGMLRNHVNFENICCTMYEMDCILKKFTSSF